MNKERYWTFIVYPESVKQNWKEYLQETGVQFAISPLHDKDINPTGEPKKPHYHIVACFTGPTTYNRVNTICEEIGATIPKRVMSVIGIIRYLTHKDNPEKYQYNEEDITTINGLDIKEITGLTTTQIEIIRREIIKLIRTLRIKEYKDLINYLLDNELYEWLEVSAKNTMFFKAYINSDRYSSVNQEKEYKDKVLTNIKNKSKMKSDNI